MRSRRVRAGAAAVAAVLALSACAEQRPTIDEWKVTWNNTVFLIPDLGSLGDPPSESACEDVLVNLRASEEMLFPTPTESLDMTVRSWFEVAEGAFFECPPASEDGSGFSDAYTELDQLQTEVDAVLATEEG